MTRKLQRSYFSLMIPAVLALACAAGLDWIGGGFAPAIHARMPGPFLAPLVFVLSVAFAVALPVFHRSLFAHRIRKKTAVSEGDWLAFERKLMRIALVTPYLVMPAFLLEIPRFYFAGTVLMALYAGYYFYPSGKRIQFERRLFRVAPETSRLS